MSTLSRAEVERIRDRLGRFGEVRDLADTALALMDERDEWRRSSVDAAEDCATYADALRAAEARIRVLEERLRTVMAANAALGYVEDARALLSEPQDGEGGERRCGNCFARRNNGPSTEPCLFCGKTDWVAPEVALDRIPARPTSPPASPCSCCCHTDGGCHSALIPQEWCCGARVLRWEHRNEGKPPAPTSPPAEPTCVECGYPENSLAHSNLFGYTNGNHPFYAPPSPAPVEGAKE